MIGRSPSLAKYLQAINFIDEKQKKSDFEETISEPKR